jgi:hypothetical protein
LETEFLDGDSVDKSRKIEEPKELFRIVKEELAK